MEYAQYEKKEGITNTMLSNFSPDGREFRPDIFHWWSTFGKYLPPTDAMLLGTTCHSSVFEPKTFDKLYVAFDDKLRPEKNADFRNTKNKEWKAEQLEKLGASKKTVIPIGNWEIAMKLQDKAFKISEIKEILEYTRNVVEQMISWEVDGVKYKCKPDINSDIFMVDGKTCDDCGQKFVWDFRKWRYHRQSGMYRDGDSIANKRYDKEFYFIAMETSEPYGLHLYKVSERVLGYGRDEYLFLGKELNHFIKTGYFPCPAVINPYTEIDY